MAKMRDGTPYSTRPTGEREREAACFRAILASAEQVDTIIEPFGGVGDTTAILRERFPMADVFSTELDPATQTLWAARHRMDIKAHMVGDDALKVNWHAIPRAGAHVGVVLDYNLCTLLRLRDPKSFVRQVIDRVPCEGARWVCVTDAAVAKLHLNWRSYQIDRPELARYVSELAHELNSVWGSYRRIGGTNGPLAPTWDLGRWAHHSRAAYLRMDRVY